MGIVRSMYYLMHTGRADVSLVSHQNFQFQTFIEANYITHFQLGVVLHTECLATGQYVVMLVCNVSLSGLASPGPSTPYWTEE